jgi:hypothetical protein
MQFLAEYDDKTNLQARKAKAFFLCLQVFRRMCIFFLKCYFFLRRELLINKYFPNLARQHFNAYAKKYYMNNRLKVQKTKANKNIRIETLLMPCIMRKLKFPVSCFLKTRTKYLNMSPSSK